MNFKLEFGNKSVKVIFNEADNAQIFTVGDYGEEGKALSMASAVSHQLRGTYKIQEPGLFLHDNLASYAGKTLKEHNVGYVNKDALDELVDAGIVSARKDDVQGYFRLHYEWKPGKSTQFWSEHLVWKDKVDGEPKWVEHNRRALALLPQLETLAYCAENGWNLNILFETKIADAYASLKEDYDFFTNGNFDALKEKHNKIANKAEAISGIARNKAVATRFTAEEVNETLIGKTVKFLLKGEDLIDMKTKQPHTENLTAENYAGIMDAVRRAKLVVVVIEPELDLVAAKVALDKKFRNDPELVSA